MTAATHCCRREEAGEAITDAERMLLDGSRTGIDMALFEIDRLLA